MILLTVSNGVATFVTMGSFLIGFVGGACWMASGMSNKKEDAKFWERMRPVNNDDPESSLTNGNTPDWKKAK